MAGTGRGLFMKSGLVLFFFIVATGISFAHCDQMNGPLVKDAQRAINSNNVNIVLKWVPEKNEAEIREAFDLVMKVKDLSPEAKILAERYFFDTAVRIHRTGEGVPFTGVKPANTPIDEKIMAADKSIEAGNLTPLKGMVSDDDFPELQRRFNHVMEMKNFDDNDVKAGREYIEAYVQFFKFAEGEHGSEHVHGM